MPIKKLSCPACGRAMKVAEESLGRKVRCPSCKAVITSDDDSPVDALIVDDPQARPKKSQAGATLVVAGVIVVGVALLIGLVALFLVLVFMRDPGQQPVALGPPAVLPPGNPPPLVPVKVEPPPPEQRPVVDDKTPKPPVITVPDLPPGEQPPLLVTDPGGHTSTVKAALFTADKKQVVTVSRDKTVRVWDVASGESVQVIRLPSALGEDGALFTGALAPDGKHLAVGGYPVGAGAHGFLIYLLSLESGRVVKTFTGHKNTIQGLTFSHDGKFLASASSDKTARLYDVTSGETVKVYQGHTDRVRQVAFSSDDKLLATVAHDATVRIWSTQDGTTKTVLKDFAEHVMSVAWHPKQPRLATGSTDDFIRLWDVDGTMVKLCKLSDEKDKIQVASLAFTPDGEEVLYSGTSYSGRTGILNLTSGKVRLAFTKHSNTIQDGRLSADGQWALTTGGDDHETYVWRVADGSVVQKLQGAGRSVWGVGWLLNGKGIAWGHTNRGNTVLAQPPIEQSFEWDTLSFGKPPRANEVGRIALNQGNFALRPIDFTSIAVLQDDRPRHVFKAPGPGERIYSMTQLGGNRAVVGTSSNLYLVDLPTNKVVRVYRGHAGIVLGVSPSPDGRHFLSGSDDQTLTIWDVEKDQPVVSLFVVGREWIAWAPQGYYASSANGERLMGWQTSNGVKAAASFHAAARFRRSLYHPDLIRHLLRDKDLTQAIAKTNAERPGGVAKITVSQVLPPAVALIAPQSSGHVVVKEAKIEVRAKAKSSGNQAVTALRLLVDGRPYQGMKSLKAIDNPKPGEVEAAWTVDLLPGKHQLAVLAESPFSRGVSPVVEVTRDGAKDDELPNLYVLAAGVSAYPGPLRLNYAHADAIAIDKALREQTRGVFRKVETRLLTDANATRANILGGLAWLQKEMTARDVAVVFLAGHGSQFRGQFHFLPVDVQTQNMLGTAVSDTTLKQALADVPGRVVVMLDACHSGHASQAQAPVADDLVRDLVGEDYGVVVLCSSAGREYSMESPATKQGFFTLGLLEAFAGAADYNRDRYVYVHEAHTFVASRVSELSQGQQNPVIGRPPHIRSFPLTKVP